MTRTTDGRFQAIAMSASEHLLDQALRAFCKIFDTHLGNIQLLDTANADPILLIVAQRGFRQPFLDAFVRVSTEHGTACGRVLRSGHTVVIADVQVDAEFQPYRKIARDAGFRAVVSCPIVTKWGHNLGIISAHLRDPGQPGDALIREAEDRARLLAHDILRSAASLVGPITEVAESACESPLLGIREPQEVDRGGPRPGGR